jgi:tape measure domain-containing protein
VTSNRTVEFKIQVDADTQGLEVFNRSLNALRKTTDATDKELAQFAEEIKSKLNGELKQSPATINAVASALKQLQQNMTAGGQASVRLGGDINKLKANLDALTASAEAAKVAKQGFASTANGMRTQIGALSKDLGNLSFKSDAYIERLQRINELQLTMSRRQARLGTVAMQNAFSGPIVTGGFGADANLPDFARTPAGYRQRLSELQQQLENTTFGAPRQNVQSQIDRLQRELRQLTSTDTLARTRELDQRLSGIRQSLTGAPMLPFGDPTLPAMRGGARRRISDQAEFVSSGAYRPDLGVNRADPYQYGRMTAEAQFRRGLADQTTQMTRALPAAGQSGGFVDPRTGMGGGARRLAPGATEFTFGPDANFRNARAQAFTGRDVNAAAYDPRFGVRYASPYGGPPVTNLSQAYLDDMRMRARGGPVQPQRGGFGSGGFFNRAGAISAGSFFGGPEGAIGGLIGGIGGAAAGAQIGILRKQIGEFADLSAQLDRYRIALKNVAGSEAEYQQALNAITSANERLNIPLLEGTQSFTQLAAAVIGAGGNIKDAELAFNAVNSAIKATGGNTRDVEGAMLAITQVFSKGKVSAEELRRQLGDRLPGAFNLFAESIGKTGPELDKALQQGEVTLNDLITFLLELETRYAGTSEEIAASSQAAGERLAAAWEKTRLAIGGAIQPLGAEIQEMLIKVLEEAAPRLEAFLKQLNSDPKKLKDTVNSVGTAIRVVGDVTEGVLQSIQATSRALIGLEQAARGVMNLSPAGVVGNLLQGRNPFAAAQQNFQQAQTMFVAAAGDGRQMNDAFGRAAGRLLGNAPTAADRPATQPGRQLGDRTGLTTFPVAGDGDGGAADKAARDAERAAQKALQDQERLAAEQRRLAQANFELQQRLAQRLFDFQRQLDEERYGRLEQLERRRREGEISTLSPGRQSVASAALRADAEIQQLFREVRESAMRVSGAQFGLGQAQQREQYMAQFEVPSARQGGTLYGGSGNAGGSFRQWSQELLRSSAEIDNKYGVPLGTTAALFMQESGGRTAAKGPYVAWAGGRGHGLFQVMPGTAPELGVRHSDIVNMGAAAQTQLFDRYLQNRGFRPGMSVQQMYATVLSGNPWAGGRDQNGTTPSSGARNIIASTPAAAAAIQAAGIPAGGAAVRAAIGSIRDEGGVLEAQQELNFELEREKLIRENIRDVVAEIFKEYERSFTNPIAQQSRELDNELEALQMRNRLLLEGVDEAVINYEVNMLGVRRENLEVIKQLNEETLILQKRIQEYEDAGDSEAADFYREKLQIARGLIEGLPALQEQVIAKQRELFNETQRLEEPWERLQLAIVGVNKELRDLQDPVRQVQELAGGIGGAFGNSFGSIITGSSSVKDALANLFRDISNQFAQMVSNIIAKAIEAQILQGAQGGGGGFFGGLGSLILGGLGGGFGGGAAVNPFTSGLNFLGGASPLPLNFSARGNTFGNSIVPFARGGIVSDPTVFKFARGGAMRAGVMAENAPEAILPLRRMPNGDLGVASRNGNGSGTVINQVSVSVDAKGSNVSGDGEQSRQLGKAISDAVQSELVRQQRPGGLLDRSRTKR